MSDEKTTSEEDDVPPDDESPFDTPPIESMPFKRGSEEEAAMKRILAWPKKLG